MVTLKEVIENISPFLLSSSSKSITLSISKRFFLFQLMNKMIDSIEEQPHLNFIALLKNYKVLGNILHGTLKEFYRDRNATYFKNFFYDKKLWEIVKQDFEYFYEKYKDKDITVTITKNGVIIYHNYVKRAFNVLLFTIHAGTWMPQSVQQKLQINPKYKTFEEDIDTHKIYAPLVFENAGIWIDNKQSRFLIDFNRKKKRAIYKDTNQAFDDTPFAQSQIFKQDLTVREQTQAYQTYDEFYFTLQQLLDSHYFNIIFDGHSMNDRNNRPNISFGTEFIPQFYMPIVKSMQRKMISLGYSPVKLNTPYGGGYIVEWLKEQYPHKFIFSMEVNKKLYTKAKGLATAKRKQEKLTQDLLQIFDIAEDHETH